MVCHAPLLSAADVNEDDLRPGLITTYRDANPPAGRVVVQLEPSVALALKAGESPHVRLASAAGSARWEGYLRVLRAGDYRFSANLRGKLTVTVGANKVLAAEVSGPDAAAKDGPDTRLEAGIHPFVAEFDRMPGAARVELFWQSPFFRKEPLPFSHLGHLPDKAPAQLARDRSIDQGRLLAEERNCVACHQPADNDRAAKNLANRLGPDLSNVGRRVFAGWIYAWLEAPDKLRPGALMPRLFSADDVGKVERHAVARYLATLGGPVGQSRLNPRDTLAAVLRGQVLFNHVGCRACHRPLEEQVKPAKSDRPDPLFLPPPTTYSIAGLGSKTIPERLTAYLQNPLAVDPSGRMPHMMLQGNEAQDLARYLCANLDSEVPASLPATPSEEQLRSAFVRVESRPEELKDFARLPAAQRLVDLGKRLVIARGCNACHTIAPDGKPFAQVLASASFDDIAKKTGSGCLADKRPADAKAPWFALQQNERNRIREFLERHSGDAGSPAPAYTARVTLERFNCLACHSRDGDGGLTAEMIDSLRRFEKTENAEAVMPPPLTGVAHKLRTSALRGVLTQGARVRPWMGLRMPQFGEANVGRLPEQLAALEGTEPDDTIHKVAVTAAKSEIGRKLHGKSAFGCISCHDLAGNPNYGTRGPDLVLTPQRVRYDWFRRWLEQAQRMQPGTRMPSVFTNGRSTVESVLNGDGDAQAEAMWAYLSLGANLPLPEGMEPPRGLVLPVTDQPVVLRTFMPDAGSRAIAVGYPGGLNVAFDAATCRLAYAWTGNFVDASPVWNNRGGAPAKVMGPVFWKSPPGVPWHATSSTALPDFVAQSKDPAYGAAMPEGKVYDGPRQLRFVGYSTDAKGQPTFRYRLNAEGAAPVEVAEKPEPLRSQAGVGLARRFELKVPAGQTAWLLAGESQREPRLIDVSGASLPFDLKQSSQEVPAASRAIVLPQSGDKVLVLSLASAPAGARWHLQRVGSEWQALLQLPRASEPETLHVNVNLWLPFRDQPDFLKELMLRK
jgi:mono/diheme cytochrome c family protein